MKDFIKQALYDRYDDFVWDNEILDEFVDEFVELVADCGIPEGATAWTIIDNRYINGEHWTYEEYWKDYMDKEEDFDETNEEQLQEIEDDMNNNGYYYKRDKQIFTSF